MYEDPDLVRLFTTYTSDPEGIGRHLTRSYAERTRHLPMLVATGHDFAFYPGDGQPPVVEGFRLSTRGFKELTGVSHLGPAVASLVHLRTRLGDGGWRADAERLLAEVKNSRAANSTALWRDQIQVEAYRGREHEIAAMVDYACAATARYLTKALADEDYLNAETLREDYLSGGPVPVNHMMVATFFLAGMDIQKRATFSRLPLRSRCPHFTAGFRIPGKSSVYRVAPESSDRQSACRRNPSEGQRPCIRWNQ